MLKAVFKNLKTARENFTKVNKIVNSFWQNAGTEMQQTCLQSLNIENFKNVCGFFMPAFCHMLLASKVQFNFFNPHPVKPNVLGN